jgi:hypothetical protein
MISQSTAVDLFLHFLFHRGVTTDIHANIHGPTCNSIGPSGAGGMLRRTGVKLRRAVTRSSLARAKYLLRPAPGLRLPVANQLAEIGNPQRRGHYKNYGMGLPRRIPPLGPCLRFLVWSSRYLILLRIASERLCSGS